jgi:type IV pilus assembly protein PilP
MKLRGGLMPALVGVVSLLLTACSGEQQELSEWIAQQRDEVKPSVQPILPPKKFNPQPYLAADAVEPFSTQKLTVAIKQEARQPSSLLASEVNRRPEPLEAFPLDSVTMVGSLIKHNTPFALLRVDKLLYQVKLGDYLGQNYGKIVKITETDMSIREVVQDGSGEWTERISSIQLQEKAP